MPPQATLGSIYNLGCLLVEMGDVARGEVLLREELDACKEMLGDRHPDTLASADNFNTLIRAAKLFSGRNGRLEEESKEN